MVFTSWLNGSKMLAHVWKSITLLHLNFNITKNKTKRLRSGPWLKWFTYFNTWIFKKGIFLAVTVQLNLSKARIWIKMYDSTCTTIFCIFESECPKRQGKLMMLSISFHPFHLTLCITDSILWNSSLSPLWVSFSFQIHSTFKDNHIQLLAYHT